MIKILIIRFSSIGDIVLTSPVVRCLKKQIDDVEIHFVTKAKHAYLVEYNPYISKVHHLKDDMNVLIEELKSEKFNYVIDLHVNFRSIRVRNALNVPFFRFSKLTLEKLLLVKFKINTLPNVHIVDRYMETIENLNVENDQKGLDFFIPNDKLFDIQQLPENFQKGYLALVVGGSYTTKKLPYQKLFELLSKLSLPTVLLGGMEERNVGEKLAKSYKNSINYVGKIDLMQSASLVEQSNIVITNDTGLMHIAAAFKKKILVFWGNTIPEFGMYPYQTHAPLKMMEVDIKCRPCSHIGYDECPKKHFNCMLQQDVKNASQWINEHFED